MSDANDCDQQLGYCPTQVIAETRFWPQAADLGGASKDDGLYGFGSPPDFVQRAIASRNVGARATGWRFYAATLCYGTLSDGLHDVTIDLVGPRVARGLGTPAESRIRLFSSVFGAMITGVTITNVWVPCDMINGTPWQVRIFTIGAAALGAKFLTVDGEWSRPDLIRADGGMHVEAM